MQALIGGFDWDHGNREKCSEHGVNQLEVEFVLTGALRLIRPISARYMHSREVRHYEAQVPSSTQAAQDEV
jgi:uncharacterized DUF497 family protein